MNTSEEACLHLTRLLGAAVYGTSIVKRHQNWKVIYAQNPDNPDVFEAGSLAVYGLAVYCDTPLYLGYAGNVASQVKKDSTAVGGDWIFLSELLDVHSKWAF